MKSLYDIKDWSDVKEHHMLGEIFMQCGKLSLEQLGMALDAQKFEFGLQLGKILINMKVITTTELEASLLLQKQIDEEIKKGNN